MFYLHVKVVKINDYFKIFFMRNTPNLKHCRHASIFILQTYMFKYAYFTYISFSIYAYMLTHYIHTYSHLLQYHTCTHAYIQNI